MKHYGNGIWPRFSALDFLYNYTPRFERHSKADRSGIEYASPGILRGFRTAALWAIGILIAAASGAAFTESYRGLYLWAVHHGLTGFWAAAAPVQVDVFIAVGELVLFVAMVDGWRGRDRLGAWAVALLGLAVSIAGNIGHLAVADMQSRATAAVPPVAAFAALWLGLGVVKRVIPRPGKSATGAILPEIPSDAEAAAMLAMRATLAAGNPLSLNQLQNRFSLTRAQATRTRQIAFGESNGHKTRGTTAAREEP